MERATTAAGRTVFGVSRGLLRGMRKTKEPVKPEKKPKQQVVQKKPAFVPEKVNVNVRETLLKAIVPPVPREIPKLTPKDLDERARMTKAWARYRLQQERSNVKRLCEIARARDEALAELQAISPQLYEQACLLDKTLWPVTYKPPTLTPPIPGYKSM